MSAKRGGVQSVERAAAILRALSGRSQRLGVMEVAAELGLPKSTVHGLLRTLKEVGFVEQDRDSGKYQLGAALLHMGSSYLDGNELRARAMNWADSLAVQSGESVQLGMLHENKVLVVHHVFRPDDSPQVLSVGSLVPAHATALGKALLAHYSHSAGSHNGTRCPATRHRRSPIRATFSGSLTECQSRVGRVRSASYFKASRRSRHQSRIDTARPWARLASLVRSRASAMVPRRAQSSRAMSSIVPGRSRGS